MKKLLLLAMVGVVAASCNMEVGGTKAEKNGKEQAEQKEEKAAEKKAAQPEQVIEEAGKKADEAAPKI